MGKRRKRCGATTRPQSHRSRSPDNDERRHYSPLTLLLLGQRQTKGSSAARMGQLNNQDGAIVVTAVGATIGVGREVKEEKRNPSRQIFFFFLIMLK